MINENHSNNNELKVEFDQENTSGQYSNFVIIAHSPSEFIFDFAQIMPGVPKAKVKSIIIKTPHHAKILLKTLQNNIDKYEKIFGEIKLPQRNIGDDFNFKFNK